MLVKSGKSTIPAWAGSFDVGVLMEHLEELDIKPSDRGNTPFGGIERCYPILPVFSSP